MLGFILLFQRRGINMLHISSVHGMRHFPPWLEAHLFTCFLLIYGLISLICWLLQNKMMLVVTNFFVCVLKNNYYFTKTFRNFCRGKQHPLLKPSFRLKRNNTVVKTLCYRHIYIYMFDKKWPGDI